jgi:hypothetical protein
MAGYLLLMDIFCYINHCHGQIIIQLIFFRSGCGVIVINNAHNLSFGTTDTRHSLPSEPSVREACIEHFDDGMAVAELREQLGITGGKERRKLW